MRWCPSCNVAYPDPVDRCEFCGYSPECQASLLPPNRPKIILTANPMGQDIWPDWKWRLMLNWKDVELLHAWGIKP
jgi:hypothetical protein